MPRKKKPPLSFVQKMKALAEAGIEGSPKLGSAEAENDPMLPLEERIEKLLGLTEKTKKQNGSMLFFVMYDIESNKVRRLVVRYLQKCGCTRIQKSVFLSENSVAVYNKIKEDLAEVQAVYDNQDSIIVLPVTTDYLRMMKFIGKDVNIDVITKTKSTLFF
jgi:CRISPR-associated endonuclease Cas2